MRGARQRLQVYRQIPSVREILREFLQKCTHRRYMEVTEKKRRSAGRPRRRRGSRIWNVRTKFPAAGNFAGNYGKKLESYDGISQALSARVFALRRCGRGRPRSRGRSRRNLSTTRAVLAVGVLARCCNAAIFPGAGKKAGKNKIYEHALQFGFPPPRSDSGAGEVLRSRGGGG